MTNKACLNARTVPSWGEIMKLPTVNSKNHEPGVGVDYQTHNYRRVCGIYA